jgi:hypothetical protein
MKHLRSIFLLKRNLEGKKYELLQPTASLSMPAARLQA